MGRLEGFGTPPRPVLDSRRGRSHGRGGRGAPVASQGLPRPKGPGDAEGRRPRLGAFLCARPAPRPYRTPGQVELRPSPRSLKPLGRLSGALAGQRNPALRKRNVRCHREGRERIPRGLRSVCKREKKCWAVPSSEGQNVYSI